MSDKENGNSSSSTVQAPRFTSCPEFTEGIQLAGISARRSGSNTELYRAGQGTVNVTRSSSISHRELHVVARKKLSQSSLPSILNPIPEPLRTINAKEAITAVDTHGKSIGYVEHIMCLKDLAFKFQTSIDFNTPQHSRGLFQDQARELLSRDGYNVLTPPARVPLWMLFLLQFLNYFMILLMICGIMTIILYIINPSTASNLYLGVFLFVVVFTTCYGTFSQEAKADHLMESFRAMVPVNITVIRDGIAETIEAQELVCGDVIFLKTGDKIPADCRVFYSESLCVNQSMITGESEPVEISAQAQSEEPLDAKNLVFSGSLVLDGSAYGVVIRTGDGSLMGTMVELTGDVGKASSTLRADIEHFIVLLTVFALTQAVVVFTVGLLQGYPIIVVFVYGFVIVMVTNVPQGLPSTVTACLYVVARRMADHNVLVKKLDIVETLGSCACVCTDKTGTLTQNRMSVMNIWVFSRVLTKESMCEMDGLFQNLQLKWIMQAASLNSRVLLQSNEKGGETVVEPTGDATEVGLYRFCSDIYRHHDADDSFIPNSQFGVYSALESHRLACSKLFEIPFSSKTKWQLSIHTIPNDSNVNFSPDIMLLKGAPDVILKMCSTYLNENGLAVEIDKTFRSRFEERCLQFADGGERVLGFAMRNLEQETFRAEVEIDTQYDRNLHSRCKDGQLNDFIFLGLISLADPPRLEVTQAIQDCRSAGVKIVMVTGDHPYTAESIAKKISLISLPTVREIARLRQVKEESISICDEDVQAVVVHGNQIDKFTREEWDILCSKPEIVFARTSPEQKLTIVNEFVSRSYITAMTGDGVNDSPALKQASIGVAMGLNGADVAKESADLVLTDDNFASIVVGIREGRLLFDNLRKSIAYTLSHLPNEVVPVIFWAISGAPLAIGSIPILMIDLFTELYPALSLTFEPPESDIMSRPPRDLKSDKLASFPVFCYAYLQVGLIQCGINFIFYFQIFMDYEVQPSELVSMRGEYFSSTSQETFVSRSGKSYSPQEQIDILGMVQSTWYMGIVVSQIAHLMFVRTRRTSIFEQGFFSNKHSNYAVLVSASLGCLAAYLPGWQTALMEVRNPHSLYVLYIFLLNFGLIMIWTEGRKFLSRTYSSSSILKLFEW